ncbi:MAG: methionyl-tRNA formyltransferase [Acidimicrobiales bacterium]
MRLVFLGTPAAAVSPLRALVDAGHEVVLVVPRADKRRGRGSELTPSPVKAAALELGLPVTTEVDEVLRVGAELGVVVAFGRIIKPHVLTGLPMVNLHFSLLPRWRGAAPVERAILAGDAETGVCVMEVEEGLDTGGVYALERVAIDPSDDADRVRSRLVERGTSLLVRTLADGLGTPIPQEGTVTYADKITPTDLRLDWDRPAADLARITRVGRAWTTFRGKRLLVLDCRPSPAVPGLAPGALEGTMVGTGEGALVLVTVQPEGRAPLPADAWRNGARPQPDERLGA